ncbi:putative rRNA maturation factor [Pillotina sp. SPG140]
MPEAIVPPWGESIRQYAYTVLDYLHKDHWELSIVFCSSEYIRALNDRFRHRDEETDVLSFPLGSFCEPYYLAGDIIIAPTVVAENARSFNVPFEEELRRLIIHGILHLDGKDHATNDMHEAMLQEQERILTSLS